VLGNVLLGQWSCPEEGGPRVGSNKKNARDRAGKLSLASVKSAFELFDIHRASDGMWV
jgi:hypothetical protein